MTLDVDVQGLNGTFTATGDTSLAELAVAAGNKVLTDSGEPVQGYGAINIGNLVFQGGEGGRSSFYPRIDNEVLTERFPPKYEREGASTIQNLLVYLRRSPEDDVEAYLVSEGTVKTEEKPQKGFFRWLFGGISDAISTKKVYELIPLADQLKVCDLQSGGMSAAGKEIKFNLLKKDGMEADYSELVAKLDKELA